MCVTIQFLRRTAWRVIRNVFTHLVTLNIVPTPETTRTVDVDRNTGFIVPPSSDSIPLEKFSIRPPCKQRTTNALGTQILSLLIYLIFYYKLLGSRSIVVGLATSYGLDDWVAGFRVPVELRIFCSPRRPNRLWSPPNLLSDGYRGLFPRG
jgi:hypothetical protein